MNNRMPPLAVIGGARTPLAKAFTRLASQTAVDLGRAALLGALAKAEVAADRIDEVIFGNVSGQPDAPNLGRVIALRAGVPEDRIGHTVNRNCASGMESIIAAWHSVATRPLSDPDRPGGPRFVVAGGTESMSNIPMFFGREAAEAWVRLGRAKTIGERLSALARFRPRQFKPVIGIELGLTDPVCGLNMGQTAEILAGEFGINRHDQDEFAVASHQRAVAAADGCFLSGEITPVSTGDEGDDGPPDEMTKDNGPRDHQTLEQLAKLRPLFKREGGTVTAGNSCPLTDGAAALVLADAAALADGGGTRGITDRVIDPLGYITAFEIVGCDPRRMGLGPVYAIARLLRRTGLTLDDFDRIELNEAFAAQVIACRRAAESASFGRNQLGLGGPLGTIDPDRTNVNGGAIALGHPVGTTGTRLVLTLLRELRRSGMRRGLATLCVGGGQGVAIMVETQWEN